MDQNSLSILQSDKSTADALKRTYAEIVDQIQKGALSSTLKNTNLSGDPESGSVVVRRLMTSTVKAYGTARAGGEGDKVANNGVTVLLNQDKEIVEEIEWKDVKLYGIPNMLEKRRANHELALMRNLDTAFFAEAEAEGTEVTPTGANIQTKLEELIQSVETVANDNVDGVTREMLVVVVKPSVYGELRNYIDTLPNPLNGGVDAKYFHDVLIYSNHRQTEDAICMVMGSIAQPITAAPFVIEKSPYANAIAVELFFHYGTKAVMPDLIKYASFAAPSA